MSRAKRNQNPITQNLGEFRRVAESLKREGLVTNEGNYRQVLELLKRYQELSNHFDQNQKELNGEQIGELNKIKGNRKKGIEGIVSAEERREIKRTALSIENTIIQREAKRKEAFEKVERRHNEAREQVELLWPQVQEAAERFLSSGIKDMDELLKRYKELRGQLDFHVQRLPDEERVQKSQEMALLSQNVNKHDQKLHETIKRVQKVIETAVSKAQENVANMSFVQMIQLMLPGVKEAEILQIAQKSGIYALEGGHVPESDVKSLDALVVANLPIKKQTDLIQVMLKELAIRSDKEAGPLAQFMQTIVKSAEELMSGEKTHLSIAYETKDGEIGTIHYDIRELLRNPHEAISRFTFEMFKQGVDENSRVVMAITSPEQVASLMLANGESIKELTNGGTLQQLTGLLLENANDSRALARIVRSEDVGTVVGLNTSEIIRDLNRSKERGGIEPNQVMNLFQIVATILETRNILIEWMNAPTRKQEKDSELLGLGGLDELLMLEGVKQQPPRRQPLPITDSEKIPPVPTIDKPLEQKPPLEQKKPSSKIKEEEVLNKKIQSALETVDNALNELKGKIGKIDQHKYDKAYLKATALLDYLEEARNQYAADLKNPKMKLEDAGFKFKDACKTGIDNAKPILEKDLGWGDYLKNLLKTLANAIVKVVSFGTSKGFFTPAKSESLKAVEKTEQDLDITQTKPSSPQ